MGLELLHASVSINKMLDTLSAGKNLCLSCSKFKHCMKLMMKNAPEADFKCERQTMKEVKESGKKD
jgi:hypothetical protein